MSKKNRSKGIPVPKPSELLSGKATIEGKAEEAKPEAKPEQAIAQVEAEIKSLDDLLKTLPENSPIRAEIEKLRTQAEKNVASKQWTSFNEELISEEIGLPKYLGDLAKKHGVDLTNRKIIVTFPDGKFSYTNSPKGKGGGAGNGRSGFPTSWGKAELVKEGKVIQTEKSPSKLAEALNLQVEGMRDMTDVFENPKERSTKAELEKIYSVDAKRGEYFRVTIKK